MFETTFPLLIDATTKNLGYGEPLGYTQQDYEDIEEFIYSQYQAGRLENAQQAATVLNILDPDNTYALYMLLQIAIAQEDSQTASAVLQQLQERGPLNDLCRLKQAQFYLLSNKQRDAHQIVDALIQSSIDIVQQQATKLNHLLSQPDAT